MFLYKRPGQRVLVGTGDMLVAPPFLEAAVWRRAIHVSIAQHMMGAYRKVSNQKSALPSSLAAAVSRGCHHFGGFMLSMPQPLWPKGKARAPDPACNCSLPVCLGNKCGASSMVMGGLVPAGFAAGERFSVSGPAVLCSHHPPPLDPGEGQSPGQAGAAGPGPAAWHAAGEL